MTGAQPVRRCRRLWSATMEPVQLFHYRDRDQVGVDMVLEHASGAVIGIEVKSAESVRADDFRGLRHLERWLGDRFRAGIVLYAGDVGSLGANDHSRLRVRSLVKAQCRPARGLLVPGGLA